LVVQDIAKLSNFKHQNSGDLSPTNFSKNPQKQKGPRSDSRIFFEEENMQKGTKDNFDEG
jgi:hypothetical protein